MRDACGRKLNIPVCERYMSRERWRIEKVTSTCAWRSGRGGDSVNPRSSTVNSGPITACTMGQSSLLGLDFSSPHNLSNLYITLPSLIFANLIEDVIVLFDLVALTQSWRIEKSWQGCSLGRTLTKHFQLPPTWPSCFLHRHYNKVNESPACFAN